MDLGAKGGGEAVCMNVLDALQDDHEVTLLTLTEPNLDELNAYFNTDVRDIVVERAGVLAPWLHERYGLQYYILQNALLGRYARSRSADFDLLVSTINELGLGSNAVQYIHFPFDWTVSLENREHIFHPTVEEDSFYERLCTTAGSVDLSELRECTLLANSTWTAEVVKDAYDTTPQVCYPPVDTAEFSDFETPWADRENGFVTVGRIERSKRIAEMIEIIDDVCERGHDVHFHIIGPTVDEEYYREVSSMANDREYVILEGEVPREELVERICTHRYGIHGKQYEHFGMAVAELAAGEAIPFVPATGGQHDIIDGREQLEYESPSDAVDRIDHVLSTPSLQRELRIGRAEIERRFGRERFKTEFKSIVDDALGTTTDRSEPTTVTSVERGSSD